MNAGGSKSSKTRLRSTTSVDGLPRKSSDYLFRPIASTNQREPPSPLHSGLRYLKLLGHFRRQNEHAAMERNPVQATILDRLERTSAFSTNYYAPLPSRATNKSIQVDDFDDLSYKSAIYPSPSSSSSSCYELALTIIALLLFVFVSLYLQVDSHSIHCLLHKKFWRPLELSNGFQCEITNITLHYVEIHSTFYQLEVQRNRQSRSCLGLDILSYLPMDYTLIPKGQIIRRNDQLVRYCRHPQTIVCHDQSLRIGPLEHKWGLRNRHSSDLTHCSCANKSNRTACFHFMISESCDLQIPWFDYCLKHSSTRSTCQAYVKQLAGEQVT